MQHHIRVYLIFWGSAYSSEPDGVVGTQQQLFSTLVGSSYNQILDQYYDGSGAHITNDVELGGTWIDGNGPSSAATGPTALTEVQNAINANSWSSTSNDQYFVFPQPGSTISLSSNGFCAEHFYAGGSGIAYSIVPYMGDSDGNHGFPGGCRSWFSFGSRGNSVAMAMTALATHEYAETATDPQVGSAWLDQSGWYEIGDMCDPHLSDPYGGMFGSVWAQDLWSNSANSCASPGGLYFASGRLGTVSGVSSDSATDAWAVRNFEDPSTHAFETLTLRWNGGVWSTVASRNPGGTTSAGDYSHLAAVSALSATDAWAVGDYEEPSTHAYVTLTLHWNGSSWVRVASPTPGGAAASGEYSRLTGVSAVSATDVWAVGGYGNPATHAHETLILHWDGSRWNKVASPNPGGTTAASDRNNLGGVSAGSATDVWAVGGYVDPITHAGRSLALRWDAGGWRTVASPSPGGTSGVGDDTELVAASVDSATGAWAVGSYTDQTSHAIETLTLHWNGATWSRIASPNPGGRMSGDSSSLTGVSAMSATEAWAVGGFRNPTTGAAETLALHWDGSRWVRFASPDPGGSASGDSTSLTGVSAVSATDVWVVGGFRGKATGSAETLVLHWNGTRWTRT